MSKIGKLFGGGADKAAQRAAEEARQREAVRQTRLAEGRSNIETAFAGFDDPFYAGRAKTYTDFAMPQLEDQFAEQKRNLIYALSRGGLLNSTSAAQKNRELQEEYNRNRELITSRGQQYGTDARRDVANNRAQLLSILSSTEDPNTVGNDAVRMAAVLREQPAFDPIGGMFTDIAGTIEKNAKAATAGAAFRGAGLFQDTGSNRSGRTVR